MLLLLTAGAYISVRRILKPLEPIGAGVAAFGAGDFSQPIRVTRPDELGALAERINGMAANLSGMLDAKRTLLLAISHELRSPLTRARVNAELLDDSPERQALMRDLAAVSYTHLDVYKRQMLATCWMPALLTSTSTPPKVSAAKAIMASISAALLMSAPW